MLGVASLRGRYCRCRFVSRVVLPYGLIGGLLAILGWAWVVLVVVVDRVLLVSLVRVRLLGGLVMCAMGVM